MIQKVISGFIISALVILAEWYSPFIWFLAVITVAIIGNYELQKLIEEKKYRHSYKLITTFIFLFLLVTYISCNIKLEDDSLYKLISQFLFPPNIFNVSEWKTTVSHITSLQDLILGLAFILVIIVNINYTPRVSIGELSFALMRILYLGFFPSYLILMRGMPLGKELLLTLLFSSAFCDMGAFFVGKSIGKHKLLPEISPNKTVEGSIGGTLACILVWVLGGGLYGLPWYHALIIGLMVAIISQMGDLIESLFKRDVGKKDSGTLIPGHGGILDRVDSYIFIAFPAYFYLAYFVF
ncbi:MAG: phosphatidate cytidylyltransferase [Candidatus Sericytochromatia bacterium]